MAVSCGDRRETSASIIAMRVPPAAGLLSCRRPSPAQSLIEPVDHPVVNSDWTVYHVVLSLRSRSHPGRSERLEKAIIEAMKLKPYRHNFEVNDDVQVVHFMNMTGG
ncbi:hypothetical protein AEQ67_25365 [Pseudomonas sp. RIT-PI-q]|nr:hypothetical protein AEQ67_25365 [Pseudomonas sp. RIT-PI-q]